jgi:hypothetical protein
MPTATIVGSISRLLYRIRRHLRVSAKVPARLNSWQGTGDHGLIHFGELQDFLKSGLRGELAGMLNPPLADLARAMDLVDSDFREHREPQWGQAFESYQLLREARLCYWYDFVKPKIDETTSVDPYLGKLRGATAEEADPVKRSLLKKFLKADTYPVLAFFPVDPFLLEGLDRAVALGMQEGAEARRGKVRIPAGSTPGRRSSPQVPKGKTRGRRYPLKCLEWAVNYERKNPRKKAIAVYNACKNKFDKDDLPPDLPAFRSWLYRGRILFGRPQKKAYAKKAYAMKLQRTCVCTIPSSFPAISLQTIRMIRNHFVCFSIHPSRGQ